MEEDGSQGWDHDRGAGWEAVVGVGVGCDLAVVLVADWPLDGDFGDQVGVFDGEERGTDPIEFEEGMFGNGILLNWENQYVEIVGGGVDDLNFVYDPDTDTGVLLSISAWFRVVSFETSWDALLAKG